MDKTCCRCGSVYEDTLEFFRKTKAGNVSSICRPCDRVEGKKESKSEACKAKRKRYRESHKEQIAISKKQYREAHKDKEAARDKLYRQTHKKNRKAYKKQYYINNPKKKKIQKTLNRHRRDAKQKLLPCAFSLFDWVACKQYFNNQCCYCGGNLELSQDHFIALSRGGEYTKNNILPACLICNSSKRDISFFEWYPQQSFYSKKREREILKYLNYQGKFQQLAI
jgi:hypothetical protein